MNESRDLVVLGFGDLAEVSAPQPLTLEALAPPEAHCVLIGRRWLEADGALLETLAEQTDGPARLVCVGVGAGGYAALLFGRLLDASAVFAAAPGMDQGWTIGQDELDDLGALYAEADQHASQPYLRLVTTEDSQERDVAVIKRLQGCGFSVAFEHAALPRQSAPLALAQSGIWARQIAAWAGGEPVSKHGDLATLWRRAFDHALEVDLEAIEFDAFGALQVSGRFLNGSSGVIDLGLAAAERVRIGARLRDSAGGDPPCAEGRCELPAMRLHPGQASPFRMSLTNVPEDTAAVEFGLVCDGRFWFDTLGFSSLTVGLGEALEPTPESGDLGGVSVAPDGDGATPGTLVPAAAIPGEAE